MNDQVIIDEFRHTRMHMCLIVLVAMHLIMAMIGFAVIALSSDSGTTFAGMFIMLYGFVAAIALSFSLKKVQSDYDKKDTT